MVFAVPNEMDLKLSGTSFVLPGESNSTRLSREEKMRGSRERALSKYPSCCYFLYIPSAEDLRVQGCLFLSWPTPRGDKHAARWSVGLAGPSLGNHSAFLLTVRKRNTCQISSSTSSLVGKENRGRRRLLDGRAPAPLHLPALPHAVLLFLFQKQNSV